MVATQLPRPDGEAPLLAHLPAADDGGRARLVGRGQVHPAQPVAGQDVQRTGDVRASDRRGRHTTSYAQLFVLPGGALLIDTPGLREMQLWRGALAWARPSPTWRP